MLNQVITISNICEKPKIGRLPNGKKIVFIPICFSQQTQGEDGNTKYTPKWIEIPINSARVTKIVEDAKKKKSNIFVEGTIKTKQLPGDDNVEQYSVSIVTKSTFPSFTMDVSFKNVQEIN